MLLLALERFVHITPNAEPHSKSSAMEKEFSAALEFNAIWRKLRAALHNKPISQCC
jgi:hypothetical protein